ncbi:MAG: hypothetical protein JW917_10860 [Ignavibacteria bacterium]|nr:hypothetical protein [Ignavibacteria bacterium]
MISAADFKPLRILKNFQISSVTPLKFHFESRLKVVTYVPLEYVDKLTFELGNAGAGRIGKYDLCSFRTKGLGTYRPLSGSKPFKGQTGKITFAEEIKLEMECEIKSVNKVINALLEHHPYEEVAYEVYKFGRRMKEPAVVKVKFARAVKFNKLISEIRKETDIGETSFNMNIKEIILTDKIEADKNLELLAEKANCSLIISVFKNKIIFKKI